MFFIKNINLLKAEDNLQLYKNYKEIENELFRNFTDYKNYFKEKLKNFSDENEFKKKFFDKFKNCYISEKLFVKKYFKELIKELNDINLIVLEYRWVKDDIRYLTTNAYFQGTNYLIYNINSFIDTFFLLEKAHKLFKYFKNDTTLFRENNFKLFFKEKFFKEPRSKLYLLDNLWKEFELKELIEFFQQYKDALKMNYGNVFFLN